MDDDERRTAALITELKGFANSSCPRCQRSVCGHVYVLNSAMGFKNEPQCPQCLATSLDQETADFLARATNYLHAQTCFRNAWRWTGEKEGFGQQREPACLWKDLNKDGGQAEIPDETRPVDVLSHDASWDADDMSCGDLVLELRIRLLELRPGEVMQLRATDPGAPRDLPAWCRLTRHELLRTEHPIYWIRRRATD